MQAVFLMNQKNEYAEDEKTIAVKKISIEYSNDSTKLLSC